MLTLFGALIRYGRQQRLNKNSSGAEIAAMLRHSYVPSDFSFGIIKPLLKCKNGDQSNFNMYRGITLTPVVSKLFESVLLGLYSEYLITDSLQYGFKKNSSCNHALFYICRIG